MSTKKVKKPTDSELFRIYLEENLDYFCEFGGLSKEGKLRARAIWEAKNKEKS